MRCRVALVLLGLAGAQGLLGQTNTRKPAPAPTAPAKYRSEVRVPFRPGELLASDVSYSTYLTAGTVTMQVESGQPSGRPVYLWISDTPSRVPVKLQSELSVGSFVLTLNSARLGQ
jgi:hypothetical protein